VGPEWLRFNAFPGAAKRNGFFPEATNGTSAFVGARAGNRTRMPGEEALSVEEVPSTETFRIVRPDGDDWAVVTPGARRVSYRASECADALARAQRIVRNCGGGVIDVLDGDGSLIRTVTVGRRVRGAPDLRVR
jgi:hypothetical protein